LPTCIYWCRFRCGRLLNRFCITRKKHWACDR
jgi:hypothetical protein